jgi:hypothetical protein
MKEDIDMFIFAIILGIVSLLACIGAIISEQNPIVPFAMLVFFTLYVMGVGS